MVEVVSVKGNITTPETPSGPEASQFEENLEHSGAEALVLRTVLMVVTYRAFSDQSQLKTLASVDKSFSMPATNWAGVR